MATERRTETDIRVEIASERDQLAAALVDLRHGVEKKRRAASVVAGGLAAGLTALAALKFVRRFGGR